MGIFVPGKDGDCMGDYQYQRFNKKQNREFAIKKQGEEEKELAENFYKRQRVVMASRKLVKKQLKVLKKQMRRVVTDVNDEE